MHNLLPVVLLVAATSYKPSVSLTAPVVNPSVVQRHDAIASLLSPSAKMKLDTVIASLKSAPTITDGASRWAITSAFPDANLAAEDVDALVVTVMAEVAESAQQDLKDTVGHLKEIAKQKDALRQQLSKAKQSASTKPPAIQKVQPTYTASTFSLPPPLPSNATVAQKQDRLNTLSQMEQQEQIRMNMFMDRMQKAEGLASDLLKRLGDTASSIIQNLK